jgi:predicted NUDIX family NTP pyrophosphohydrolase
MKVRHVIDIPEIDRAAWFSIDEESTKIMKGQLPMLQTLAKKLVTQGGVSET